MNAFKIAAVAVAMTLGASAVQAEEMRLDEAQLDVVTAGLFGFPGFSQFSFQSSGSSNGKSSGRVPQGVSPTSL